ncbi:MAG TPA: hypothetical protein VGQ46_20465 [Thermoanaerobaculia bacterium]|nr:hypothetical protein [Thermoanaerobaculia bacterium]
MASAKAMLLPSESLIMTTFAFSLIIWFACLNTFVLEVRNLFIKAAHRKKQAGLASGLRACRVA